MKHINKYNKFIKLNEEIEIIGDIDEYDINLIKDALIDLEDLGCDIYEINKYDDAYDSIGIKLKINSTQITKNTRFICKFDKNKFNKEENQIILTRKYEDYLPTEYERKMINITKDNSQFLLNMLDYNDGAIYIVYQSENLFHITIFFYKTKHEY
jgi:hypothetical protein